MIDLLVIVGPTASGKTALSLDIAKRYQGEIIAADSRTVYSYLDVGTAKPSTDERGDVKHWGLDLVGPEDKMTVAQFKQFADEAICAIRAKKHLPIIVGGSGLYIDAVVYNFNFAPTDIGLRKELSKLSVEQLQEMIKVKDLQLPENYQNKRYLIRTIERGNNVTVRQAKPEDCVIIGIDPGKEVLKNRITHRVELMLRAGLVEEIRQAAMIYGWDSEALTGNAYKVCRPLIEGREDIGTIRQKLVIADMQLAKKQMTWFKRNLDIHWFKSGVLAIDWLDKQISSKLK